MNAALRNSARVVTPAKGHRAQSEIPQTLVIPEPISDFGVACCRFTLQADQALSLPDLPGVPLSKAAGQRFKELFCIQPGVLCESCILHPCCLYTCLYETVRPKVRGERDFPPPFVARAVGPKKVLSGEFYVFDLLLFGDAIRGLPAWVVALQEAGRIGLHDPRYPDESAQTYHVVSVDECRPDGGAVRRFDGTSQTMTSYAEGASLRDWCGDGRPADVVDLTLLTPFQFGADEPEPHGLNIKAIVTSAMRRLECLTRIERGEEWNRFADRVWDDARRARIREDGTQHVRARVLHRSKASWKRAGHKETSTSPVKYHGYVGRIRIESVGLYLAWLLEAISILHFGRKAGVGMGWLEVRSP